MHPTRCGGDRCGLDGVGGVVAEHIDVRESSAGELQPISESSHQTPAGSRARTIRHLLLSSFCSAARVPCKQSTYQFLVEEPVVRARRLGRPNQVAAPCAAGAAGLLRPRVPVVDGSGCLAHALPPRAARRSRICRRQGLHTTVVFRRQVITCCYVYV